MTSRIRGMTAATIVSTLALATLPAGAVAQDEEAITIGAILKPPSFDYFARMERGLRDATAEFGVGLAFQAPAAFDAEEQVTRFEILKTQHFDCLILNPVSGTNLNQALVGVEVPIVNIDSPVNLEAAAEAGVFIDSYVGSDNVAAGGLGGDYMVELLGGEGGVAAIAGEAVNQTSMDRVQGFKEAAVAGGLEIIQEAAADWDRAKALTAAEDIIRVHPEVRGFFAANDGMGLGIQQAVENAGRADDIFVISVDGDWEALLSIQDGRLAASVSQYPYAAGEMAVEACIAAAAGVTLPEKVDAPIAIITPENVAEAIATTPETFFDYEDPYADLMP